VLAGLAAFVFFTALSAAAYPGGTFCDAHAAGYRFWENFFCDLTQPVTQVGVDNSRARGLAEASFVCFSLALGPFFWVLGAIVGARLGALIRGFGLVSALGTNVIAWLPSVASPFLHQLSVFSAAVPGLLATSLGVWGELTLRRKSWRDRSRSAREAESHASALARPTPAADQVDTDAGRGRLPPKRVPFSAVQNSREKLKSLAVVLTPRAGGETRVSLTPRGALGGASLVFGIADAAHYAYAIAVPGCYPWLPALQKLSALCLMAWMLSVARAGLR